MGLDDNAQAIETSVVSIKNPPSQKWKEKYICNLFRKKGHVDGLLYKYHV